MGWEKKNKCIKKKKKKKRKNNDDNSNKKANKDKINKYSQLPL